MANDSPSLTTDDQEQLVAYLDGELPADQFAAVEERLSVDEPFRREMQRLARAWDVLDRLPQATAGDAFAKTTIEMVTVAAEEEIAAETAARGPRRIKRGVLAAGLLVAAVIAGFVGARSIWPDPNRQLIADLPIIEYFDAFSQFRDVAFLRSLRDRVGGKHDILGAEAVEAAREDLRAVSVANHDQRRQRVRELDVDQARDLTANFARFSELDRAEQRRLRQLHEQVVSASDAEILIDTMNQYAAWLSDRSAGDRAALRELSMYDRIQRIEEWLDRERFRAVPQLSSADRDALRKAITVSLHDKRDEILRQMNAPMRDRLEKLDDREFARRWMRSIGLRMMRPRRNESAPLFGMYQEVRESLSQEAQRSLDRRRSVNARVELMRHWIMQAFQRQEVTEKELEEFFASDALTPDEREVLLGLPQKQMRQMLEGRYYQQKYGIEWERDRDPLRLRGGRPGDGPPRRGRGGMGGGRERFDRSERPPGPPPGPRRGPERDPRP